MKSKRIPDDIKTKSIKEAQNEIKEIITELENKKENLEKSLDSYNRMLLLNYHIEELFRKKNNRIKNAMMDDNEKNLSKNYK